MATQREYLEQDLAKSIKEFGPDSASVKHLKAQIASLGTVRHPSQLAALNSSKERSVSQSNAEQPQLKSATNAVDNESADWL